MVRIRILILQSSFFFVMKINGFHYPNQHNLIGADYENGLSLPVWIKILAWKKLNRNFFPYFYAMIHGVMLSFVPALPKCYLLHSVLMAHNVPLADRNSHKFQNEFCPNLCQLMWIQKRSLHVLLYPFDVDPHSCSLLVDKNTPYPMALENQHGRRVDNDAITPVSMDLIENVRKRENTLNKHC